MIERRYASGVTQTVQAQQVQGARQSGFGSFIEGLNTLTQAVAPVINTELQKKIELDKQEQVTRKMRGLAVDEDATRAGAAAYNLVDAQQDFIKTQADINSWIEDQYRMGTPLTPEHIEDYRKSQYSDLIDRHPDVDPDKTVSRFLSMKMQESAPTNIAFEYGAQRKWEQAQAQKAVETRIGDIVNSPHEQIQSFVPKLVETAAAMKVSEAEVHDALVKRATLESSLGDGNLLDALSAMPEFRGNTSLMKARTELDKLNAAKDSIEIGTLRARAVDGFLDGQIPESQFDATMADLQRRYGNDRITDEYIEGVKRQYMRKLKEGQTDAEHLQDYIKYFYGKGEIPWNGLATVDDKVKAKMPALLSEYIRKAIDVRVQKGEITEEQAHLLQVQEEAIHAEASGLAMPALKSSFQTFQNLDPESFKKQELPAAVLASLDVIGKLKPATRAAQFGEKGAELFDLYTYFTQEGGLKSGAAYEKMTDYRDNPVVRNNPTEVRNEAKSAVTAALPSAWFNFGDSKVPKWQRSQLEQQVLDRATKLVGSGFPAELAAKVSMNNRSAAMTQVSNGTYVNLNEQILSKDGVGVSAADFTKGIPKWIENNIETLRKNANDPDLQASDISFDYHNGMVSVKYKGSMQISAGRRPISEFTASYRAGQEKKLKEGITEAQMKSGKIIMHPTVDNMSRLVPAMIKQESGGKQSAVSKAGATGVMQIMKATGPDAAKAANLPWDENRWKNDAGYNRKLGEAYMGKLLKQYNGDLKLSLAAYNWGMGNVDKSVKMVVAMGKQPTFENIRDFGNMPKETRDYIPKVLRNMKG